MSGFVGLSGGGALNPGLVPEGVLVMPPLTEESSTDDDIKCRFSPGGVGEGPVVTDDSDMSAFIDSVINQSEVDTKSDCVDSDSEYQSANDSEEGSHHTKESSPDSTEGSPEQPVEDGNTSQDTWFSDASSREPTPAKGDGLDDVSRTSSEDKLTSAVSDLSLSDSTILRSPDKMSKSTTPDETDSPQKMVTSIISHSRSQFGLFCSDASLGILPSGDMDSEPGDPSEWSAIWLAATIFNFEQVNNLLKMGTATEEEIHFVDKKGRNVAHEMVLGFLEISPNEQVTNRSRLVEILSLLVQRDLDINHQDKFLRTPLHYLAATPTNQSELIKTFQACGARVSLADVKQQTALHWAASRGCHENVDALLMGGANPNQQDTDGRTALHLASSGKRQLPTVQCLLRCAAHANMRDGFGRTALHVASKAARADLVLELLTAGSADVNVRDNSGQSALHLSTTYDVTGESLRHIVYHEGDINMQDTVAMETALHKAIRLNMYENLQVLVKAGVDPNIPDVRGDTPLHLAARCKEVLLWKDLMELKGNVRVKNFMGHTPLLNVHRAKNQTAVCMMQQYGLVD